MAGSPADRADLEVGDEILEVNGRSLDDCSHNEVISHIHQCIRSRTVCLRVRRRPRLGEKRAACHGRRPQRSQWGSGFIGLVGVQRNASWKAGSLATAALIVNLVAPLGTPLHSSRAQ